jgi:hypothetical protein
MDYFGIDLHQKHSEICGLDAEGRVKYRERMGPFALSAAPLHQTGT